MTFDLLVFDLDGTLIDSRLDLALAVNAAREDAGMGPLDHELIYSYVGNGAPMLIRRSLGTEAADQQVDQALRFFYGYYREHMLDNTYLYPGVQESLDAFLAGGRRMAVLTNKPVRFSQEIIKGLGLAAHFERVYGGNSFETKKPDPLRAELSHGRARGLQGRHPRYRRQRCRCQYRPQRGDGRLRGHLWPTAREL